MAESIENKILEKVKKCGRGCVFFVSDFVNYGTLPSVNKALERMTTAGTILRVARGIYCYPKILKEYGIGVVPPSVEEIVKAMARRDGAKVISAEAWAQNKLGISQQIPMNYVYLTNGPARTVMTESGACIKFKHASPRYFTMKDPLGLLITTALKDWKVKNLNQEQLKQLKDIVVQHGTFPPEDLKLMPARVRELLQSFLKEK